jgi:hypothetical protein
MNLTLKTGHKILQKGDCPMLKITVRYTRYVLAALATIGFRISVN